MLEESVREWEAEMRVRSLEEGRQEGRSQERVALLLRLLERKFGPVDPAIRARVRGASPQRLLIWAEAVLEADDLDDVFAAE